MTICAVEVGIDTLPISLHSPRFEIPEIVNVFVRVTTSEGVSGLGYTYAFHRSHAEAMRVAIEGMAPTLIGRDPAEHPAIERELDLSFMNFLGGFGLVRMAWAAIDTSLWDCLGKMVGRPLQDLLGVARATAPVYATGLFAGMPIDEVVERAVVFADQGFGGVKVHIDPYAKHQLSPVVAVCDALSGRDIDIMVDAAQAFDLRGAIAFGEKLSELGVYWFEDPIEKDDLLGLEQLIDRVSVPIAVGENFYTIQEVKRNLDAGARTMLLDIARIGGVTGFMAAAGVCDLYNAQVTSHIYTQLAAQLLCSTRSPGYVEHLSWYNAYFRPVDVGGGTVKPSTQPGVWGPLEHQLTMQVVAGKLP